MAGKRMMVTGGTGMIGINLLHRLVAMRDLPIECLLVTHRAGSNLKPLSDIAARLTFQLMDLDSPTQIEEAVSRAKPDIVFHLGSTIWSQVPRHESDRHFRTNVLGSQFLLEAVLRESPNARVVFSGSSAAYGPGSGMSEDRLPSPNTIYGASKAAVSVLLQTYARLYDSNAVELRLFTPYGPWEDQRRLLPHVIRKALGGEDVELTSGVQERDFVFVGDVVEALILAAQDDRARGEIINIASGQGIRVRDAAETVVELVGREDVRLLFGSLEQRSDEMLQMSADISKASNLLGWRPRTTLVDGIGMTLDWISAQEELSAATVQRTAKTNRPLVKP